MRRVTDWTRRLLPEEVMEVWATWEFWLSLVLVPAFFVVPERVAVILIGILSCWALTSTAAGRISASRAAQHAKIVAENADVEAENVTVEEKG